MKCACQAVRWSGSSPLTRGKRRPHGGNRHEGGLIPAHAGKTACRRQRRTSPAAHPRSRGENVRLGLRVRVRRGSSPLTRGKRDHAHEVRQGGRLIPAHAGKTPVPVLGPLPGRAHPRSRGENDRDVATAVSFTGSSPLTRGKPFVMPTAKPLEGLIPAHAGKTGGRWTSSTRPGAHPRSRGENVYVSDATPVVGGSSPLTRGKLKQGVHDFVGMGLIPAHAGKTPSRKSRADRSRAHPRSRGENHTGRWAGRGLQGSSPLTRGTLRTLRAAAAGVGLIPAHTGKTASSKSHRPRTRAHPHSCGENVTLLPQQSAQPGSSPLTRGKLRVVRAGQVVDGLIPAHAGKTRRSRRARSRRGAHPRSCGENPSMPGGTYVDEGSSPLTRGKPAAPRGAEVRDGLIPAHAGKTRPRSRRYGTSRAHPRSCGENAWPSYNDTFGEGSSPLMRGKHGHASQREVKDGLIPTHEGKTRTQSQIRSYRTAHPRSSGENEIPSVLPSRTWGSSPLTRGKLEVRGACPS